MALPVIKAGVDYEGEKEVIVDFLRKCTPRDKETGRPAGEFEMEDLDVEGMDLGEGGKFKYQKQLQQIANREQEKLVVELDDIARFQGEQHDIVQRIKNNAKRYADLFSSVVDSILPVPTRDLSSKDDVIDVIIHQRREQNARNEDAGNNVFPSELIRRYNLYLKPLSDDRPLAVRDVRSTHVGKLITVRGIVTRVSEVKPLLRVNAFTCDMCQSEVFQDVEDRSFMPLTQCPSEDCQRDNVKGQLHMQTRACKFSPFQEVKIQEMADQVPVGHIPRTMTIHLNGNMVRSLSPGDVAHIGGIFLPIPFSGFRAMKMGLLTDTYLEAHHCRQLKKQYEALGKTPEIDAQISQLKRDPNLYIKLAQSIAPEIYGHEDVKKALLLLLVGGVTKSVGDGLKIRGDINICLTGDPGVAKSQLLKYITKIAPRGVYTTGRGSSGVGLTAAVMRDPVTDEMVLEGGALVLADNGIACIDEFDKMDESDRTAIHEVMEQQTISIAKAGITTTLNARTSILAAANPLYGRYNPKISPVDNINLPAALLSRFDVMFLILDTPSREDDERLAMHVTHVHMFNEHPPLEHDPISPLLMRHYIAEARKRRPVVLSQVSQYVVDAYVQLRRTQKDDEAKNQTFTYTSARTLLAILRLSQALARLRHSDFVAVEDVDEALRLMEVSKASLLNDDDGERDRDQTPMSKIFRIIRDMSIQSSDRRKPVTKGRGKQDDMEVDDEDEDGGQDLMKELLIREIRERVIAKGFTEQQLQECLSEYESLDVWTLTETTLTFIEA